MIRKLLPLFFLLSLFSNELYAQFEAKKVPRSHRKNVIQLSRYLCEGLSSDSAKVIAISSWIAANIEYDYRSLINGDWSQISTDHLLKRKKGLCGDFSNLFNEMCLSQGIISHTVTGYTRTFNYQPYDSLIRAEHAWNVVLVNGRWRPIDLSWSVGYVKQRKQKVRTQLYLWFGIPYHFKYKFVQELNNNYILIDPEVFMRTHAPLQPYWQLLNNPVPMKAFEADSVQEYLKTHNSYKDKAYNFELEIKKYESLSEKDKHLVGAKQAFQYNPQNHRILGLGYYNFSQELINEIDENDIEEAQIEWLDSSIVLFDTSKVFFDKFKKDLRRELIRRQVRNSTFKTTLLKTNKTYIKSFKSSQKIQKKQNRTSKSIINKNVGKRRRVLNYESKYRKKNIKKIKRNTKGGPIKDAKIANYQAEIMRLDSALTRIESTDFTPLYYEQTRQKDNVESMHPTLKLGFDYTALLANLARKYRFEYNEYSRIYLDPLKDTIGLSHEMNQSRYDSINWEYTSIYANRETIIHHYVSITDLLLKKAKLYEKLKRASEMDLNEDELYIESRDELTKNYLILAEVYDTITNTNKNRIQQLKVYKSPLKRTIKMLEKEIKYEYRRYRIHNKWYRHLYVVYKRQADGLKLTTKLATRSSKKRISYLNKEIKKRELEVTN